MHKVTANLELEDGHWEVVKSTAAAYQMEMQEFLDRCLMRGLMSAEQEVYGARAPHPPSDYGPVDDDIPF